MTLPPRNGLSGTLSATAAGPFQHLHSRAGLFIGQDAVELLSSGPFRIDHDQALSVHGTAHYDAGSGLWLGVSHGTTAAWCRIPRIRRKWPPIPISPICFRTSISRRSPARAAANDRRREAGYESARGAPQMGLQLQVTNLTNRLRSSIFNRSSSARVSSSRARSRCA